MGPKAPWTIECAECGKGITNASIRLEWEPPATTAQRAVTIYEHLDATACTVPASSEGLNNLLAELRRIKGLSLHELRPEGEASKLAAERFQRISN